MFQNDRYITRGIKAEIPIEVQAAIWTAIDLMPDPKSYWQVFNLEPLGEFIQNMTHAQEQPEYTVQVFVPLLLLSNPATAKIYVIDDGDHSTMMLASEY